MTISPNAKTKFKLRAAEAEVGQLFSYVPRDILPALAGFPRDLETILATVFPVRFEKVQALTLQKVAEILRVQDDTEIGERVPEDPVPLGAYVFAKGGAAVIFVETMYGENYLRFGIGHEGGHLFSEYVKKYWEDANQSTLFEKPAPTMWAHREPPGYIDALIGTDNRRGTLDSLSWLDGGLYAMARKDQDEAAHKKREAIANAFSAEILMPRAECQRFIRDELGSPGVLTLTHVMVIKRHFGVSEWALMLRLLELEALTMEQYANLSGKGIPKPLL